MADDSTARLVILSPSQTHSSGTADSAAIQAAEQFLNLRGSGPRIYRNTLVFVAADKTRLPELEDAIRWNMAWDAIYKKREELDLNQSQIRTAEAKAKEWAGTVRQRIGETYYWLLVPTQSKPTETATIEPLKLRTTDSIADRSQIFSW